MVLARIPLQTQARAGAVQLLEDYKADTGIGLQIYPGRPSSVQPPTAFIDAIGETLTNYTVTHRQRLVTVQVLVLHGVFDHKDTVAQRDAFVDGWLDWIADRFHAFGANTDAKAVTVEDIPVYVPDWLDPSVAKTYFATRISLEGFAAT